MFLLGWISDKVTGCPVVIGGIGLDSHFESNIWTRKKCLEFYFPPSFPGTLRVVLIFVNLGNQPAPG